MITRIDKLTLKALRYIDRAREKGIDRTPILSGINSTEYLLEACDGFRYHAVNTSLLPVGILDYEKPAGIMEADIVDGTYPDTHRAMPTGEPSCTITVKTKFLRDALTGLTENVTLVIYDENRAMEILGKVSTDKRNPPIESYALIMPKQSSALSWRPYTPDTDTDTDTEPGATD